MSRLPRSHRPLAKFAAALACGVALNLASPLLPATVGLGSAAHATTLTERFQATLARYGTFQAHARYGEVWVPSETTAPTGWHPYAPCNWVYSKDLGWYYDDKSEWGAIVHHYGRWAHDASLGWVWVKGEEFSPGWVVWRTNEQWVGWAPLPPEQDVKEISAAQFNTDKHWIFMDAKKFGTRCDGGTIVNAAPAAIYPTIFETTTLVTEIKFVHGIAIFVLPPPLIINIFDIDIGVFPPWSPCFFGAWFWNWNWMVNNIVINVFPPAPGGQCVPEAAVKKLPLLSTPPPAPGGKGPAPQSRPERRTELTPNRDPGSNLVPETPPRVSEPPVFLPPPVIVRPRPPVVVPPIKVPGRVTDNGSKYPNGQGSIDTTPPKRIVDPGPRRPIGQITRPMTPVPPRIIQSQNEIRKAVQSKPNVVATSVQTQRPAVTLNRQKLY